MFCTNNINVLCFFVLLCFLNVFCQLYEGSECVGEKDGIKGTCVLLKRCLSVVDDLRQRIHPQICSFKGQEPIVCCTDCELVDDNSNVLVDNTGTYFFKKGPKAYDKCLEYIVKLNYSCSSNEGLIRELDSSEKNCYNYDQIFVSAEVGGIDAIKGEYPHMALLGYGDDLPSAQWLCGGSVISNKFILTAGHCIGNRLLGQVKYVALGILKRTDPPEEWQRYNVKRIISHPQYKPPSKYHDIALLEVEPKIVFSRLVLPACLNTGENFEDMAKATGWGALGHRKPLADTLQVINLNQYTAEECAETYPPHRLLRNGYDNNTQSCYGQKNNITDTCEGDSGGPLQVASTHGDCFNVIIGVTSFGRSCGVLGSAGIYTRVSYYVPWIESIVWP